MVRRRKAAAGMAFRGCQRSTWAGLGRPARARAATVDKLDVPAPQIKGVAVRGNRVVQHASDKGRLITRASGDRRSFQKRPDPQIRASSRSDGRPVGKEWDSEFK